MLKWLPRTILLASLVAVAALSFSSEEPALEPADEIPSLAAVVSKADRYGPKEGEPLHYACYLSEEPLAVAWSSLDVTPSVRGYAGPIQLLIGMDFQGRITGVEILAHNETPVYVAPLLEPWFTEQFSGKEVTDDFTVGADIDGVTRATVTAEAISNAVGDGAHIIATRVMQMDLPPRTGTGFRHLITTRESLVLLALVVFALVGHIVANEKMRMLSSVVALFFVGVYLSGALALAAIASLAQGRAPGFGSATEFYVLLVFAGIAAILFGRVYCGWLCPFGAIYSWIRKLRPKTVALSRRADSLAKAAKYILASGLIWAVFATGKTSVANIEPYNTLFSGKGSWAAWSIVAITVLMGFRIPYMWCRYFCPVGATLGVLSSRALEKLVPRKDSASCPVGARPDGVVDSGECIRCNGCKR